MTNATTPTAPPVDTAEALAPLVRAAPTWVLVLLAVGGVAMSLGFPLLGMSLAMGCATLFGAHRRAASGSSSRREPAWVLVLIGVAVGQAMVLGAFGTPTLGATLWTAVLAVFSAFAPPRSAGAAVRVGLPLLAGAAAMTAFVQSWTGEFVGGNVGLTRLVLYSAFAQPAVVLLALLWHSEAVRSRWLWGLVTAWLVVGLSVNSGASLFSPRGSVASTLLEAVFATLIVWIAGGVARSLRQGPSTGGEPEVALLSSAQRAPWSTSLRIALLGMGLVLLLALDDEWADATSLPLVLLGGSALVGAVAIHVTGGARRLSDRAAPWAVVTLVTTAPATILSLVSSRPTPVPLAQMSLLCAAAALWGALAANRWARGDEPSDISQPVLLLLGLLACAPTVAEWTAVPGLPGFSVGLVFFVLAAPVALTLVVRTGRPRADWLRGAVVLGLFTGSAKALVLGEPVWAVFFAPAWALVWLLAACVAAVCARARSFTAVPADHPIFVDFPRSAS